LGCRRHDQPLAVPHRQHADAERAQRPSRQWLIDEGAGRFQFAGGVARAEVELADHAMTKTAPASTSLADCAVNSARLPAASCVMHSIRAIICIHQSHPARPPFSPGCVLSLPLKREQASRASQITSAVDSMPVVFVRAHP
jgi:hypothetical protein